MEEDEQMITPPSVMKIVTGQGPSPADVQGMLRKLPYIALYITRRGITETSPELADVIYQYPTQHQSKLLQAGIVTGSLNYQLINTAALSSPSPNKDHCI